MSITSELTIPIEFRIDPADPKAVERNVRMITEKLGPVAAALQAEGFEVEFVADNIGKAITVSVIVTAFKFEVKTGKATT